VTPARLLDYARALREQRGPHPHLDPAELATWLEGVAVAMEEPLEVIRISAFPGSNLPGAVELRGPADHVVATALRGALYRRVVLLRVDGVAP
jgi:hypothetical protein